MQHGATEQWGGSRHCVPAHQKDFSRIHDVKNVSKAERLPAEYDGKIYCAPPVSSVGYGVVGGCKGGRTGGVGCVDVGGSVGEIASSVSGKTTYERHRTVRGVKAPYSKSIITRDFGCAIRRGVRFVDGPRRDRPSPSRGVELNDLGVTSRGHSECEFR